MIDKTSEFDYQQFFNGEALLIDKPYGLTSFDVIRIFKKELKIKKIGHAGTLDPLATGLMIYCTGKETKSIVSFQDMNKVYQGIMVLGATTPGFDMEKPIDKTFPTDSITEEAIYKTKELFEGKIQQIPPAFSAIKIKGKRAYDLAKKGQEPEIKPREVIIHEFEILGVNFPEVEFRICCSKGTYIRSIARDFGLALNNGAYLKSLRRLKIGEYSVENAFLPSELVNNVLKKKNETGN